MRIKKIATVGAVFAPILLVASPAAGAQSEPALRAATIQVTPAGDGSSAEVREVITLDNVERDTTIENKLPIIPGVEISGLSVMAGGESMDVDRERVAGVENATFPSPSSGTLRYEVRYEAVAGGGENRIPLLVPGYAAAGGKVVRFLYRVPDGYYLQGDAFPAVAGTTGSLTQNLSAVPTLIDYQIDQSPPGVLNTSNVASGVVVALIVIVSIVVFRREARSPEGGTSRV